MARDARQTLSNEFLYRTSEKAIQKRMEQWADKAWTQYRAGQPEANGNEHFEAGFKTGYLRYLRNGKTDDTALPPPKYTKAKYVSWGGRHCVEQWIQGKSIGSIVAAQSGRRELIKVPFIGVGVSPGRPVTVDESENRGLFNQDDDVYPEDVIQAVAQAEMRTPFPDRPKSTTAPFEYQRHSMTTSFPNRPNSVAQLWRLPTDDNSEIPAPERD